MRMMFLFLLLLWTVPSWAAVHSFQFTPPTQREDNSPLPAAEIAEYEVEWTDGTSANSMTIPGGTNTTFDLDLSSGSWTVTVFTVDTGGRRSQASVPHVVEIPVANPNPPTDIRRVDSD